MVSSVDVVLALCALLFFAALFLVKVLVGSVEEAKGRVRPLPGPTNLPFLGGILQILSLGKREHNYDAYHAACAKYGSVMGFRGGSQHYLITEDAASIREILCSADWMDRFPSTPLYQQHTFGKNLGLLFGSGDPWRETRRFVTRTLGEHGFGDLRIAEATLRAEIDVFLPHVERLLAESEAQSLKVNKLFHVPSLNITWVLIAGHRFSYDDEELRLLMRVIEKGAECEFGLHPVFSFPFLDKVPGLSPIKKFKEAFDVIHAHLYELVKSRGVEEQAEQRTSNLMDTFLASMPAGRKEDKELLEGLLVTISDLLVAAMETTSTSVAFAVLYLLNYPDVQTKLQAELDEVLGGERPSVYDKQRLPYTEATTLEVFRMASVTPIHVRNSTRQTSVGGFAVKKGVFGVLNVRQMHMDADLWGDPLNFRPERFLDSDGKVLTSHGLIPFGAGRRVCVGQNVAKLTFFVFLTTLLQKYSLSVDPAHPAISTNPSTGFTNTPKAFHARFCARQTHDPATHRRQHTP